MTPIDWFALTSLCWLPILIGIFGVWGLARMLEAFGWLEEECDETE